MDITKINCHILIRNTLVSSFITFGLIACASSPAPWTQKNDSPWSAKHASQLQNVPLDEAVTDVSDEPVLLEASEPVAIEPMMQPVTESSEPIMINEPVMVKPIVEQKKKTTEQKVLAMPAGYYAVQVYASNTVPSVDKFRRDHNLHDLTMVKTERSGSTVYILIDIHADRNAAKAASIDLEKIISAQPWVRPLSGIQKIITQ